MLEIIYIHIPKTGGSSIMQLFQEFYDSTEICTIKRNLFKENPSIQPSQLLKNAISERTKVLHGHFTYEEVAPIISLNPKVKIITFLREPIDRVVSNYNYFVSRVSKGKVPEHQFSRAKETLLQYAALPDSQNRMTKFLKGIPLEKLYFIGFMESFEVDVTNFFKSIQRNISSIPLVNKNIDSLVEKKSIPRDEYDLLTKFNAADIDLYQKAKEISKSRP